MLGSWQGVSGGKKLRTPDVEITQSREVTFRVEYVNAIVFAKLLGGNCPVCS